MKVMHIQTTVSVVFGVDDGEGNVIPQEPVEIRLNRFNKEAFAEGFEKLEEIRDQATPPPEAAERNRDE